MFVARAAFVIALGIITGAACAPTADEPPTAATQRPSQLALDTAEYTFATYREAIFDTIGELVAFRTVAQEGVANAENPEFRRMTDWFRAKAAELGFDFADHGAVVVIGMGDSPKKLGIVMHADVQPADETKWNKSPFELDRESEPDKLIGRGVEDDKGPIAIALYAMKALKDCAIPLDRRIELVISYTEESDWNPFFEFLKTYEAGDINVALDSMFPVVTAEKGWCQVTVKFPLTAVRTAESPALLSLSGGAFLSQVPENGVGVLGGVTRELETTLRQKAEAGAPVNFTFETAGDRLTLTSFGKSAHSSEPEGGHNGITALAEVLGAVDWTRNHNALAIRFINEMIGGGNYAEKFGSIAYSHELMGPLTLVLSKVEERDGFLCLDINLRRPAGKEAAVLDREIKDAVEVWRAKYEVEGLQVETLVTEPHLVAGQPHIPALLGIYEHYTGEKDPRPRSSGGGTHARLLPNGVNFGPHRPHRSYTGHTEKEYLSLEELDLDIRMYAAMMVQLSAR